MEDAIEACLVKFEAHGDARGTLTVAECGDDTPFRGVPFEVKRVFWITNARAQRGGHSHKRCRQVLVALSGACRVTTNTVTRQLYDPQYGLYVPVDVDVTLDDFAPGTVILVLCSEHYDAEDAVPCCEQGGQCGCTSCTHGCNVEVVSCES